jgi:GT2 family glycosyltransferase
LYVTTTATTRALEGSDDTAREATSALDSLGPVQAMQPSVSLVLPNRNNQPVLDLFFRTLERNTDLGGVEMIAVDDGSTDRGADILRRWRDSGRFAAFELLERPQRGIVDTLNEACERASGDVIVRLDGDATLETPGWLDRLMALHGQSDSVGVVAGGVVFDSGRVHSHGMNVVSPAGIHSRGTIPTEPVGSRTLDVNVEYPPEEEAEGRDVPAEVDGAIGCCMLFRKDLWSEVGGFDTRYSPAGFEDFDFALGARATGRKVFSLPEVRVVHRISMRNPREQVSRRVMALYRLRRAVGRYVPARLREAAAARAGLGDHDPERVAMLRRHYASWRDKWGFDALNPDMDEVRARWAGTEVMWAYDDERRRAGEEIVSRYTATPARA